MVKAKKEESCCSAPGNLKARCRMESLIGIDERGQMVLPKELRSESAIKINLLTQLVSQTIKTHDNTLIVIEGYRGPDCFKDQARIKENYQMMLQGIISSSLTAPDILLGNTAILVQG